MDLKPSVILHLFLQFSIASSNDLEEGSPCTLRDGHEGICVKLSDCRHASSDFKHLVFPKFCSMNLWQPLVCCLDCNFLQDRFFDGVNVNFDMKMLLEVELTDSEKANHELMDYKKKQMGCQEEFRMQHFPCNKYEQFKDLDDSIRCYDVSLVNGDDEPEQYQVKRNNYPHLALIGFGDNPTYAEWLCSGSVISDKYILTAAHCTSNPELGEIKFAALGTQQWPNDRRYWQIYRVAKIIVHPNYVPPSMYHDIALLETGTKIIYNLEVIPACLQREGNMAEVATATGWGPMGPQKHPSEILNGVNIVKFSHERCMEAYPKNRHLINGYNSYIQTCYGDGEYINDNCEGDSGGPLQLNTNMRKAKCLHMVIGVSSYGRACGLLGSAGLYTRIAPYVPWIESITGHLS